MEIKLKTHSGKVKPGDTFIAIKNVSTDGHDYIEQAINNGATKIICEHGEYEVETEVVEDTREYLKNYLYENYYPLIKDLKMIGVTGTNGKTTTCYMLYQMLQKLNKKVCYIGTIGIFYNDKVLKNPNTTPDVDMLYQILLDAKEEGIEYVVMEVSSHALANERIYGLEFDAIGLTNITQDHLDFHKTMENYANTKAELFNRTRGNKVAIINKTETYGVNFIKEGNNNIIIGDDVVIEDIKEQDFGIDYIFNYQGKYEVRINAVGIYNVDNSLMAILLLNGLGFEMSDLIPLVSSLMAPPGRMEMYALDTNRIFVDYAHTPDALENSLKSVIAYKPNQIITVFGCGGNRDAGKRPLMGGIASEYSTYVIVTRDNPRYEDEDVINEDIIKGIKHDNYEVIKDRYEAIKKGISMLKDRDILLVAGKGHETGMYIKGVTTHFSDSETIKELIKSK